jgi:hypothetical protein
MNDLSRKGSIDQKVVRAIFGEKLKTEPPQVCPAMERVNPFSTRAKLRRL